MNAESAGNMPHTEGVGTPNAGSDDTPGSVLRRERERRGWSVQQAAEDLHLDVWMVEALEGNRFLALGAPVYAKGHLRKYALLLALDPEDIMRRYRAMNDTPVVPTPQPTTSALPSHEQSRSWIKRSAIGGAVALVLLLAVWIGVRVTSNSQQAPAGASAPTDAPTQADDPPPPTAAPVASVPATTSPAASATVATASAPAPTASTSRAPLEARSGANGSVPPAQAAGAITLRLQFSEPSWVEVYDANDQRLMYDMGIAGRSRTLSGTPPLRVVLGLASGVTAEVNGAAIVVPRRAGREQARFAVDANGVVR
jgi:cytoskeleton protein RodZ